MGTYDWTANRLAPKSSTVGECTRRVSYRPEKGRYRIGYRRGANSDRLQPMDHRDDAADAPLPYPFLWRPRRDGAADHSDRTELSPSEASEVSAPPASPSLPNRVA